MAKYTDLIAYNTATAGARRIGVYDSHGNRVGQIPLGSLTPPVPGKKLYSFGALSDVHLTYTTGESDFINALKYLAEKVDFICISGDLATVGTDDHLSKFMPLVNAYAPNTPVYVSAGNHDAYDANHVMRKDTEVSASMLTHTGNPLYYSFERGEDVYIFVGVCDGTFSKTELQWLYETLERYRDRRCFLFQHVFSFKGSGNVFGLYNVDLTNNTKFAVFESLLQHYHNVIWFHGHSHTKFHGQEFGDMANLDRVFSCWSVHVPSIAVPRTDADGDFEFQIEYQDSEGYVVDVYENGIHLRGRDFVKNEFLPIASYWLDTPLQTVAEGAYTDSTGTIIVPGAYQNQVPIAIDQNGNTVVEGAMYTDSRWDFSGGVTPQEGYFITGLISAKPGDFVRIRWDNTERYGDAGYQCIRAFGADRTPIDIRLPFLYMFDPSTDAGAAFTSVEGFRYDRAAGILDFQVLAYSSIPWNTEYLTFTLTGDPSHTIITVNQPID